MFTASFGSQPNDLPNWRHCPSSISIFLLEGTKQNSSTLLFNKPLYALPAHARNKRSPPLRMMWFSYTCSIILATHIASNCNEPFRIISSVRKLSIEALPVHVTTSAPQASLSGTDGMASCAARSILSLRYNLNRIFGSFEMKIIDSSALIEWLWLIAGHQT